MIHKQKSLPHRFTPHTLLGIGLFILVALLATGTLAATAGAGQGQFNIADYGAVGDGVTNDAAAIQRAVDAAAGGGTVIVPSGTFAVGSTINLRSGVTLQGDDSTFSMGAQGGATVLLNIINVNHVTVRGLTLRSTAASGDVIGARLAGHSDCVIDDVSTINTYYGLKIDTSGSNLTVRNFRATGVGQPIYCSNLNGGLFENLDLDAVLPKLESVTFHALYLERNNRSLTFRSTRLTGGSGFTLQLYTDAGWTSPSDGITFDGLTVDGRWTVVVGSGFQNITFRNVTARATQSDDGVFTMYDPRTVKVDGFTVSGGSAMLGVNGSTQAQGVLFQNGAYSSPRVCDDLSHFTPNPIGPNVVSGTTPPPTVTTTIPATTTTRPPSTTTTIRVTTTLPPVTTTTAAPTTTTAPRVTTTSAPPTTTTVRATTTTIRPATTITTRPMVTTTTRPNTTTTTPPPTNSYAVAISQPTNNAVVSGRVSIKTATSSAVSVNKVRFYADGKLLITDYRSPFAATWNVRTALSGSTHRISAAAYDQSGSKVGECSVSVTVASFYLSKSLETATWAGSTTGVFADLAAGSPYSDAIASLSDVGIVSGFSDGSFGAGEPTMRAQAAKMVCNTLGVADSDATATPFTDLDPMDSGLYPHKFVAALVGIGAVQGTSPRIFSPWDHVSRAQIVTILVRALQTLDPRELAQPPLVFRSTMGDFDPKHDAAMRIAEYNGLLTRLAGFGPSWDPCVPATRGEVAQILNNLNSRE